VEYARLTSLFNVLQCWDFPMIMTKVSKWPIRWIFGLMIQILSGHFLSFEVLDLTIAKFNRFTG